MAIQMTREEYERKYGVPPPQSSAVQPIKMTRAEYNAKTAPPPVKFDVPLSAMERKNRLAQYQREAVESQKEADKYKGVGFLKQSGKELLNLLIPGTIETGKDVARIVNVNAGNLDNIVEAQGINTKTQAELLKKIREKEALGQDTTKFKQLYNVSVDDKQKLDKLIAEQSDLPSKKKVLAQMGMMGIEILSFGTYGSAKGALAGMQTGKLTRKLPTAVQGVVNLANKPAGLFTKKGLARVAEGGAFGYGYDVASGLAGQRGPEREGADAFTPGLITGLGLAFPGIIAGAKSFQNVATKSGRNARTAEIRTEAFNKLERDNKKVRDAFNKFREKYQKDPTNILANSEAGNDIVDNTGTINVDNTLSKLNEVIDSEDSIVYEHLRRDGTTLSQPQFVGALYDGLRNSDLELTERAKLTSEIRKLTENLKYVSDAEGKIALWKIHKGKISLGQKLKKQWGTSQGTVNKALYGIYQDMVERFSKSIDVADHNRGLSEAYGFREVLQSLQGRKVEGGRLGKHVSAGIGSMIGMSTGNPLVALAGAKAGSLLRGQQLKGTFGGRIDRPFIKSTPPKMKKPSTTKAKVDVMPKRTFVTKLKEKIGEERAKVRSMIRQTGQKGSIGGEGASPEPSKKLSVSPENVAINERMQIIDPTREGADALLGTMGDLSPELRSAVIKAQKSGDTATVKSLLPKIVAELEKKLAKKSVQGENVLKTAEEESGSSSRLRMPISEKFQEGTEKAFRLLNEGKTAEADARFVELAKQQLNEFKNRLKAVRLFKEGKDSPVTFLTNSVGFKQSDGYIRPTFEVNIRVAENKQDAFYAELARSAKELGLERIDSYKLKPGSSEKLLGVVDKEMGITNHPHFVGFLSEPLPVSKVGIIRKAQQESGLPEVVISDGGRRLDIPFIKEYSKENYERFIQQHANFIEALKRGDDGGVSVKSELRASETRTLTRDNGDRGTTFGEYQSAFYRKNPELYSKRLVSSPVVDRLRYETAIPKGEFLALLNELPVTDFEKTFYHSLLDGKADTAQVKVKDLFDKVAKRGLQTGVRDATDFSYISHGYGNLFRDISSLYKGEKSNYPARQRDDMYTLFLDAKSISDEDRSLASHGGAKGTAVVGHARVSPVKGEPVLNGPFVTDYKDIKKSSTHSVVEFQNDPFQESRGGEGNWADTKRFLREKNNDRKGILKEEIDNLFQKKNEFETNVARAIEAKRNLVDGGTPLPTSAEGRAIYDARNVLQKIKEYAQENNIDADVLVLDSFVHDPASSSYQVSISHPGGTYRFEHASQWPGGTTSRQINLRDIPVVGERGLEGAIARSASQYPETQTVADFDMQIREWTNALESNKRELKEKTSEYKKLLKTKDTLNLPVAEYLDLKNNQRYYYRLLREVVPFMYKEKKATHLTIPTLSTVARGEWKNFMGERYFRLEEARMALTRRDSLSTSKSPYKYWVEGKKGEFGNKQGPLIQPTEKIVAQDPFTPGKEDSYIVLGSNNVSIKTIPRDNVKMKTTKIGLIKARQLLYTKYTDALLKTLNEATGLNLERNGTFKTGDLSQIATELYHKDFIHSSTSKFKDSLHPDHWNYQIGDDGSKTYTGTGPKTISVETLLYRVYQTAVRRHGSFKSPKMDSYEQYYRGVNSLHLVGEGKRGVALYRDGYLYEYTWDPEHSNMRTFLQPHGYSPEDAKGPAGPDVSAWDDFDNMTADELTREEDSHKGVLIYYAMVRKRTQEILEEVLGEKFQRIIDESGNSHYLIKLNKKILELPKITFDD